MNGNPIYNATTIGATTMTASGQISANNFNTASVAVNPTTINIGSTQLDGGGLGATGITVSYANISGNVNNLCPVFSQPNYYITNPSGNLYYKALTPGTFNVKCTDAPPSTGVSFQLRVEYTGGQSGVYRICNQTNASGNTPGDNMTAQFTTVDSSGNYWNWGQNTQLNPGQSLRANCWFCGGQNRFVFTDIVKEDNPVPSN